MHGKGHPLNKTCFGESYKLKKGRQHSFFSQTKILNRYYPYNYKKNPISHKKGREEKKKPKEIKLE